MICVTLKKKNKSGNTASDWNDGKDVNLDCRVYTKHVVETKCP